jgi:hypothetical protein
VVDPLPAAAGAGDDKDEEEELLDPNGLENDHPLITFFPRFLFDDKRQWST